MISGIKQMLDYHQHHVYCLCCLLTALIVPAETGVS